MHFAEGEKTAAIYARVSTSRQAAEDLPIASQVDRCEQKAAELGARVVARFIDPGISGRTEERPEFQRAIEFCETAAPDYLITWSTSRFARDRTHAALYKVRLEKADVRLVYCTMDIDRGTDSGWLLDGVMELLDEHQSRQTAADTIRSMVRNARRGYWNGGNPPFGYRPVPAPDDHRRKKLAPDATEAWVVERIFAMKIDGLGTRSIAAHLNELGVDHRGSSWKANAVAAVLRSRAVIGQSVFGKKDRTTGRRRPESEWIIVDSHDPVIPMDLWTKAQGMLDSDALNASTGSPHSTRLFTGILRCGHCGSGMQVVSAKGRSRRYYYYRCQIADKQRSCKGGRLPAPELDEWLVDLISDRIFTRDNLRQVCEDLQHAVDTWAHDRDQRRRSVASQIADIQKRTERLYELFEEHGRNAPNLGDLSRRLRQHNAKLRTLEDELQRIDAERPPRAVSDEEIDLVAEALKEVLKEAKNPKKVRSFFGEFIDAIYIDGAEACIEYKPERLINVNRRRATVPSSVKWLPGPCVLGTARLTERLPPRFARRAA